MSPKTGHSHILVVLPYWQEGSIILIEHGVGAATIVVAAAASSAGGTGGTLVHD